MTAYQGQPITLESDWYAYNGGPLVAVTGLTIHVQAPDSTDEVAITSVGITNPATGIYQYIWNVPLTAQLGTHVVSWAGTYGGNPVSAVEALTVASASNTTWCTTDDVLIITGSTVTQAQLLQAGFTIDIACARAYAVDGTRIGSRDLYFLSRACAWQAVWLASQPDAFNRIDALDISQGRSRTQLRDTAMFLSPFARKALKRVSWLKTRSLHVKSPFQDGMGVAGVNPLSSAADDLGPWTPIQGW